MVKGDGEGCFPGDALLCPVGPQEQSGTMGGYWAGL